MLSHPHCLSNYAVETYCLQGMTHRLFVICLITSVCLVWIALSRYSAQPPYKGMRYKILDIIIPFAIFSFALNDAAFFICFRAPILLFRVLMSESLLSRRCSLKFIFSWILQPNKVSDRDGFITSFPVFKVAIASFDFLFFCLVDMTSRCVLSELMQSRFSDR